MQHNPFSKTPQAWLRGVFLLAILTLITACKEEITPDWSESNNQDQPAQDAPTTIKPQKTTPPKPSKTTETRFLAYNLKNYLIMERMDENTRERTMLPKPEKEINALIAIIKSADPHILGICEIGTPADLKDLQNKLKSAGLDYPHTHFASGSDPFRRLAVLSKFPVTPHPSPPLEYRMKGSTHLVNRGFLDATIQLPSTKVRFIGAHLKSKRQVEEFDEAIIRRNEANVLRAHITKVLKESDAPLLVYGDFNDTKRSPTISTIKGPRTGPLSLYYLDLKAPDGSKWTHHWDYEDIYSRFDWVFVSPTLRKLIDFKNSHILAPEPHDPASDHRPILVIIKG